MNPLAEFLPWVQAFGWSLVHFIWQGLLVGALFATVRALVRNENSSGRYAIGLAALALLAICPLLTLWVLWPHVEIATPVAGSGAIALQTVTATSDGLIEPGSALGDLLPALVLGWLAGVVLMVGRAVHQWRALERIATRLAHQRDEIDAMLMRVAARLGDVPGVRVLVSAFIDTPTLIGWFKPVILLPAAVVARFPREQLELILAHELGHLRRYDHLVNLGQVVVETLLFYHPVVHWISREVRHEREICCDNLVLELTHSEPREYARTLAALEDVRQLTPQLAVAASGGMLLDRVRRIVGARPKAHADRHAVAGTWFAAVAATIAIVATLVASQTEVDESLSQIDQPQPPLARVDLGVAHELAIQDPAVAIRFADLSLPEPAETAAPAMAAAPRVASVQERPLAAVAAPPVVLPLPEPAGIADMAPELAAVVAPQTSEPAATPLHSPLLPTVMRMVSPSFPDSVRGAAHVKVGFEFSIDDSGKVRGISVVSGDEDSDFADAARRALRQWRFDPDSRVVASSERYRQEFEFVGEALPEDEDDSACIPRTGSHVCRPLRTSNSIVASDESSRTAAHVVVLGGRGSH